MQYDLATHSLVFNDGSTLKMAEHVEVEKNAKHDCIKNAVPYVSDGPLGHGWDCGICGAFLQAG
jgi:hypothetical protein